MRDRKKVASLVLVITILASVTAGCGTNTGMTDEVIVNQEATQEAVVSMIPEATGNVMEEKNAEAFPKMEIEAVEENYTLEGSDEIIMTFSGEKVSVDVAVYPELAKSLEDWSDAKTAYLRGQADEYYEEVNGHRKKHTNDKLFYTIRQNIVQKRADAQVFSIENEEVYDVGGVHESKYVNAASFDVKTGKELCLDDIVLELDRFEMFVIETVKYTISQKYSDVVYENYTEKVIDGLSELKWVFTDCGMEIIYSECEIGPYVAGIIRVEIPYSKLEGYVKEEYQVKKDGLQ